MELIETAVDAITGRGQRAEPVGTIKVVDPSAQLVVRHLQHHR